MSLTHHVKLRGHLPPTAAVDLLRNLNGMALRGIRRCGVGAAPRAMTSGIPVITAKWGDPIDYVAEDTSILTLPGKPVQLVGHLANAASRMARNPGTRLKMGRAGRRRAKEFYDRRANATALMEIHQDVLGGNARVGSG